MQNYLEHKSHKTKLKAMKYLLLLITTALLTVNSTYSQGIITRTFSSGYVTDTISLLQNRLVSINDSTLGYTNYETSNGREVDYILEYNLNKIDLSVSKTDTLWNRKNQNLSRFNIGDNQTMFGGYIKDEKHDNYLHTSFQTDSLGKLIVYFRNAEKTRIKGDTLFKITRSEQYVNSLPFVYDSSIYLYTVNYAVDSSFCSRYDYQGNLLAQRIDTYTGGSIGNITVPFETMSGPTQIHPLNDSILIFEDFSSFLSVYLVDRFTLDTTRQIGLSFMQRSNLFTAKMWLSIRPIGYSFDSLGITNFGTTSNGVINIGNPFLSIYKIRLDWAENVISMTDFGPSTIDTRARDFKEVNGCNYLLAMSPYSDVFFESPEYRQFLLIKDSPNKVDSIYFFGNKNHVGLNLVVDDNGDAFIMSQFSNAWSDDSLFYEVTKVPAQLLVSIQEQKLATSIKIYPNPTVDYLKSEVFKAGQEFQIYTANGLIMKSATINSDGIVDVQSLKPGTYFLQLLGKNGSSRATVFIKN